MSDQLYQDRIVALAKAKTGAGKLAAPTRSARRDNPLCGDRVTIDVRLDEQRHDRRDRPQVRGCLLCQASASALASVAVGRDAAGIDEVRARTPSAPSAARRARRASRSRPSRRSRRHKSRQECVLLPFEALKDALS